MADIHKLVGHKTKMSYADLKKQNLSPGLTVHGDNPEDRRVNMADPDYDSPDNPGEFMDGARRVSTNLKPDERGTGKGGPAGV